MLKLPKMQPIKMVQHREMKGTLSSVTISKTPTGKYYASILVEYDPKVAPFNGGKIGADLGLKDFLITSEGLGLGSCAGRVPAVIHLAVIYERLSLKKCKAS